MVGGKMEGIMFKTHKTLRTLLSVQSHTRNELGFGVLSVLSVLRLVLNEPFHRKRGYKNG